MGSKCPVITGSHGAVTSYTVATQLTSVAVWAYIGYVSPRYRPLPPPRVAKSPVLGLVFGLPYYLLRYLASPWPFLLK